MQKHDTVNGVPIMSWCPEAEDGAIRQITDAAKHPKVFNHVALMPDAHQGYGVPIGAVVALKDAISPNMVGVDIGCGMMAVKTSLKYIEKHELGLIKNHISKNVPVGFSKRSTIAETDFNYEANFEVLSSFSKVFSKSYMKEIKHSMGTLGGGNHFIEIQKGDDGHIWIMIHSGSRNLGKKVNDHFHDVAMKMCDAFCSERNDIAPDLAFLPFINGYAAEYQNAMNIALDFAKENRKVMMRDILKAFDRVIPMCSSLFELDVHHNYASLENHFGKNVWVHRKGATSAREGQLGIIPGSMGTCSYIVEGLGNPLSFNSCSHGAGRVHSRTQATLQLDVEAENKKMDGIVFDGFQEIKRGNKKVRGKLDLGECAGAYKNIDEVMQNQNDLVKIHTKLEPLMVVKG